jgi:hypothetical protein
MLWLERFDEVLPRPRVERPAAADASRPWTCEPGWPGKLAGFPAFALMRLVRDWVEGDQPNWIAWGVWRRGVPARLEESVEYARLGVAHAVVGHLCGTPDDARLRDANLARVACLSYWGPGWVWPLGYVEEELSDDAVPGRANMLPWWRAAAMLPDPATEMAAIGMHYFWLRRHELDLPALAAEEPWGPENLLMPASPGPLRLPTVLQVVFGPDESVWPPFERDVARTLPLDSTLGESVWGDLEGPDLEELTGLTYEELFDRT